MKTCLISSGVIRVPPKYGGAVEQYVYQIARNLKNLGVDVDIIDAQFFGDESQDEKNELKIIRLKTLFQKSGVSSLTKLSFGFSIVRSDILKNYRIIHVNTILPGSFVTRFYKFRPIIYTCHNSDWVSRRRSFFSTAFREVERNIMRRATAVIALSRSMRKRIIKFGGINPKKVRLIPNGVDTRFFMPIIESSEKLKEKMGLYDHKIILFVGRITYMKGVDVLIRAFSHAILHAGLNKITLLLVGPQASAFKSTKSGRYASWIKMLIEKLGIKDNVRFVGKVSNETLRKLYSIADVFVLPSRYEGMPLAILEAMSAGLPVLGSKVSGIVDVIEEGINGYSFNPEDHKKLGELIMKILGDEKLKKRLGDNSRILAERRYDWNIIAKKIKLLYESLT